MPTAEQILDSAVRAADPEQIREACARLGFRFDAGLLIGARNRYATDTLRRIKADKDSVPPRYRRQLSEYLAAAALVHNMDGWRYLSRAVGSTLHGSLDTAIHLTYYAELRAALAILSANGVGIFNYHNVAIDKTGADHWFGFGTHTAAWKSLDAWANTSGSGDELLNTIGIAGWPLADWIRAAHKNVPTSVGSVVAKQWLKDWSIDLSVYATERERRNQVSYRPQKLRNASDTQRFGSIYEAIGAGWQLLEPGADEPYSGLDHRLLYHALTSFHQYSGGAAKGSFESFVEKTCSLMGLAPHSHVERALLAFDREGPHELFVKAWRTRYADEVERTASMMARAILLLRLSAAFGRRLLRVSGARTVDLAFWWQALGEGGGFWAPGKAPDRLDDLWADVKPSLDDLQQWLTTEGKTVSLAETHAARPNDLLIVQQLERAAIWGALPDYEAA